MPLAWHLIMSAYGFWLPNDPRGSWSKFVGRRELVRFGKATRVNTRRSLASEAHDSALREAAKGALEHPPARLSGRQALAVGGGFRRACDEGGYVAHACAILPDHAHLVLAWHDRPLGQIVAHLKTRARQRLAEEGLWPGKDRPLWGRKYWAVFLDTPEDIGRAVAYVVANPAKEGKPPQRWSFVTPYAPSAPRKRG